jgi:hypothetical protein
VQGVGTWELHVAKAKILCQRGRFDAALEHVEIASETAQESPSEVRKTSCRSSSS